MLVRAVGRFWRGGIAAACLLAAGACPVAAEPPARQPDEAVLRLTVRSPAVALRQCGDFVQAITRGSPRAVTDEYVTSFIRQALPFSFDVLEPELPLHILVALEREGAAHAAVLHVRSFADFLKALENSGVHPRQSPDGDLLLADLIFGNLPVIGPMRRTYALGELADGRVLLVAGDAGEYREFRDMLNGWPPEDDDGAPVAASVVLPENWALFLGPGSRYYQSFEQLSLLFDVDEFIAAVERHGLDPDSVGRLFRAAEYAIAESLHVLSELRRARVSVSFDGESLRMRAEAPYRDNPGLAWLAKGGAPARAYPVHRRPGRGAAVYLALPPLRDAAPETAESIAGFVDGVVEELQPGMRGRAGDALAGLLSNLGGIAAAAYVKEYRQHWAVWMQADDPAAAVAAVMDVAAMAAEWADGVFAGGEKPVRFVFDEGEVAGLRYRRSRAILPDEKRWNAVLRGLSPAMSDEIHAFFVAPLAKLSFLVAAKDDTVVMVNGPEADEADLAAAVAMLDGGGEPMLDDPATQRTLRDLPHRRLMLLLTDGDAYLLRSMLNERSAYPSSNYLRDIVEQAMRGAILAAHPGFVAIGETTGIGVGAGDEGWNADFVVPTRVLNGELINQHRTLAAYDKEYRRLLEEFDAGEAEERFEP